MTIRVRDAYQDDAEEIAALAAAAWRDTYAGLLPPDVIEEFVATAYSLDRLRRRIVRGTFLVAQDGDAIVAFANARAADDHAELAAIYALPLARGHGAGTALLAVLRDRFPGLPIAANVLTGNRKGEIFYERRGFVPRENVEADLFGERVFERRWWLEPVPDARPEQA